MPITNAKIADILNKYANNLEAGRDDPYRVRAYRRAAKSIAYLAKPLYELVADKNFDLKSIPHVGKKISQQVNYVLKTGHLPAQKKTSNAAPARPINDLKQIKWLGPKRIKILKEQLNITSRAMLEKALKEQKLSNIKGFGKGITQKILNDFATPKRYLRRFKLSQAMQLIEPFLAHLKNITGIKKITMVGDARRRTEVVHNLDILISLGKKIPLKQILNIKLIRYVLEQSKTHLTLMLYNNLQVSLYFSPIKDYVKYLIQHTGGKDHLQQLMQFKNPPSSQFSSEVEFYHTFGLDFIPPELRENRGEIAAAVQRNLPKLIELKDMKGDLHCHTWETDGTESLEAMVAGAMDHGYEYVAITDHSQRLAITNGLNEKRLWQQIKLIDKLNATLKNIVILKSIEVDILADGSLDLSNNILKELDIRVCSIHSKFKLSEAEQTERIIRAMDNPYFNILGHATGRIINYRDPYAINFPKILAAAKERHCFLELNAQPSRLDINDEYCLQAKRFGVKIAISSDAHSTREFNFMPYGIYQARRGWLEKDDVINTRSLPDLLQLIKRH